MTLPSPPGPDAAEGSGRRRAAVVGAALVVVLLVGVAVVVALRDGDDDVQADATTTTAGATSTTEGRIPGLRFLPEDPFGPGEPAPLTGLPVADADDLARPLLAVKVDDLDVPGETARPQAGLAAADVVVEEVVEGGITRFVVLVHSTDAPTVGPVRSARTTDVHLLPAFGRALFAYSGGNPGVLAAVRASPSIVDRGGEWPPAYARDPDRRPPHDLFVRTEEVWALPDDARPPRPLGPFLDAGAVPEAGRTVEGIAIDHGGPSSTPIRWEWRSEVGRWVRYQAGTVHVDADGLAVGPRNVLVLFTDQTTSPADPRSPEVVTVGSGEAWVLSGGRLVEARWERPDEDAPFSVVDAAGEPVPLVRGRTWIELVGPEDVRVEGGGS